MAKKPKKGPLDSAPEVKSSPDISFRDFFDRCIASGRLQKWQESSIQAFFKDMRLKDKEELATYEAMLQRY